MVRLIETATWWALLVGGWLLTLSTLSTAELVVAAVVSVPCAAAATLARRAVDASWRVRPGWVRWLAPLVVATLADTVRLAATVLRRRGAGRGAERGRVSRAALPAEADGRLAEGRRALASVVLSIPPGSFVVDSDGDELALHKLVGGGPRMEEVVRG